MTLLTTQSSILAAPSSPNHKRLRLDSPVTNMGLLGGAATKNSIMTNSLLGSTPNTTLSTGARHLSANVKMGGLKMDTRSLVCDRALNMNSLSLSGAAGKLQMQSTNLHSSGLGHMTSPRFSSECLMSPIVTSNQSQHPLSQSTLCNQPIALQQQTRVTHGTSIMANGQQQMEDDVEEMVIADDHEDADDYEQLVDRLLQSSHDTSALCLHDQVTAAPELTVDQKDKVKLLNLVAGAMLASPNFTQPNDLYRKYLCTLARNMAYLDPEFVLKVALYARSELNIRTISNFMLALAATLTQCRPFIAKYFGPVVRLPSDLVEVANCYAMLTTSEDDKKCPLPVALRKSITAKFPTFDTFQLAKHNKVKRVRTKKNKKGASSKRPSSKPAQPVRAAKPKGMFNLKKLVRQLHLQKPAETVMSIVGKKYPEDTLKFARSGLLGVWESDRAGKRMRLPVPETWETQISTRGNKPAVWQDLLDHNKLPYMAMLRNLRNMIVAGISDQHHAKVIRKLQDERAVINSRQFPFRFFSAYKVIDELREFKQKREAAAAEQPSAITKKAVSKKVSGKKDKNQQKTLDARQKAQLAKLMAKPVQFDEPLLKRYQSAIDGALKVATKHNINPIAGRTLVFCDISAGEQNCGGVQANSSVKSVAEIGILLGLMCKHACEDCHMFVLSDQSKRMVEANTTQGTILDNMTSVLNQARDSDLMDEKYSMLSMINQFTLQRQKIDSILYLGSSGKGDEADDRLSEVVDKHRISVNSKLLYANVNLTAASQAALFATGDSMMGSRNIHLRGYSDQLLRYVSERGNANQLAHVDSIDRTNGLVHKQLTQQTTTTSPFTTELVNRAVPEMESLKRFTVRSVRVFISSTFRDMHSERNLLIKHVMPQLQRAVDRKYNGRVLLCPIDLRWGVTQNHLKQESTVEQCLREVLKSDILVAIIGRRYGFRPSTDCLHRLKETIPELSVLLTDDLIKNRPSVTELEIRAFLHCKGETNAWFLVRYALGSSEGEMVSQSKEGRHHVKSLIRLADSCGSHMNYYNVSWSGGRKKGYPIVKNLLGLGYEVARNILRSCDSIMNSDQHTQMVSGLEESVHKQWALAHAQPGFKGCTRLLTKILKKQKNVVVVGEHDIEEHAVITSWLHDWVACEDRDNMIVIPCLRLAWTAEPSLIEILKYLCQSLDRALGMPSSDSCSTNSFRSSLDRVKAQGAHVVVVLGHWPMSIITQLCFFEQLSMSHDEFKMVTWLTACTVRDDRSLSTYKSADWRRIDVPSLQVPDRRLVVNDQLQQFGKQLDEQVFDNQMQQLVNRRQSSSLLYLRLACKYLRVNADYESLRAILTKLPSSIDALLREGISQIQNRFGQSTTVAFFSSLAYFAKKGIAVSEQDLYSIVALVRRELSKISGKQLNWSMCLQRACKPAMMSRALFLSLLAAADLLLDTDTQLRVQLVSQANVLPVLERQKVLVHSMKLVEICAAAHCFVSHEHVQGDHFRTHFLLALPYMVSNNLLEVHTVFHNLDFLRKVFGCKLCMYLCMMCDQITQKARVASKMKQTELEFIAALSDFATRNAAFLEVFVIGLGLRYPSLLEQQILSLDTQNPVRQAFTEQIEKLNETATPGLMQLAVQNKKSVQRSLLFAKAVTALAQSDQYLVAGFSDGSIIARADASEDLLAGEVWLQGHSDAVTDLCALPNNVLISTSADASIIAWDLATRAKLGSMTYHRACVTGAKVYSWDNRNTLVTVSWDCTIRQWNTKTWKPMHEINTQSGVNCLDVQDGCPLVVTGHWDSALRLHDLTTGKRVAVWRGHSASVRAVQYICEGSQVASADMNGSVCLWSASHGIITGALSVTDQPVTSMCVFKDKLITGDITGNLTYWNTWLGTELAHLDSLYSEMDVRATAVTLNENCTLCLVAYVTGALACHKIDTDHATNAISASQLQWRTVNASMVRRVLFIPGCGNQAIVVCKSTAQIVDCQKQGVTMCTFVTNDLGVISSAHTSTDICALAFECGTVCLYNLASASWRREGNLVPVAVLNAHEGQCTDVALSAHFNMLMATVGVDMNLIIWKTAKVLKQASQSGNQNLNTWTAQGADRDSQSEVSLIVRAAHKHWINCVAFSDTNPWLATGSNDCLVKIWKTDDGALLHQIDAHGSPIVRISFKRSVVVSMASDGGVRVCSSKGYVVTSLPRCTDASDFCFKMAADNQQMDWASAMEMDQDEQAVKRQARIQNTQGELSKLDKSLLAICHTDGTAKLINPFKGSCHQSECVSSTAISSVLSSANHVLSADQSGTVRWWTMNDTDNVHIEHNTSTVTCVHLSPDQQRLCIAFRDGGAQVSVVSKFAPDHWINTLYWKVSDYTIRSTVWLSDNYLVTMDDFGTISLWYCSDDKKPTKVQFGDSDEDMQILEDLFCDEPNNVVQRDTSNVPPSALSTEDTVVPAHTLLLVTGPTTKTMVLLALCWDMQMMFAHVSLEDGTPSLSPFTTLNTTSNIVSRSCLGSIAVHAATSQFNVCVLQQESESWNGDHSVARVTSVPLGNPINDHKLCMCTPGVTGLATWPPVEKENGTDWQCLAALGTQSGHVQLTMLNTRNTNMPLQNTPKHKITAHSAPIVQLLATQKHSTNEPVLITVGDDLRVKVWLINTDNHHLALIGCYPLASRPFAAHLCETESVSSALLIVTDHHGYSCAITVRL